MTLSLVFMLELCTFYVNLSRRPVPGHDTDFNSSLIIIIIIIQ